MSLLDLPQELIDATLSEFSPSDISPLRLTCKRLCHAVTDIWTRGSFKQRTTDLSPRLLNALEAGVIAHPTFSTYVKHLHIGKRLLCNRRASQEPKRTGKSDAEESGLLAARGSENQLAAILGRLPNCRRLSAVTTCLSVHEEVTLPMAIDKALEILVSTSLALGTGIVKLEIFSHAVSPDNALLRVKEVVLHMTRIPPPDPGNIWSALQSVGASTIEVDPGHGQLLIEALEQSRQLCGLTIQSSEDAHKQDLFMRILRAKSNVQLTKLHITGGRCDVNLLITFLKRRSKTLRSLILN